MPIASFALNALENRLPKVISPRTHGYIDYAHAAFFLSMAIVCRRRNPGASLAALATGTLVLAQSLLTDYPLGVEPLISFETHGKMDAAFAAASFAIPNMFGFEGTGAADIFRANAFVEATVVGLTDFRNEVAQEQG